MSTRPDVRQLPHPPATNPGAASHAALANHASHASHANHAAHAAHAGHPSHTGHPSHAAHPSHPSHPQHAAHGPHGPHGGHPGHGTHGPHANAPPAPNPHHALYRLPQMGQRHVPVTNFIPVSSDSAPMSKSIRGPSGPASIIPSTLGVGRSSSPSIVMQAAMRQTSYPPTTSTSGYLAQNHRSSGLQITSGVDPHVRYAYPQQGQPTSFASMQRDPAQGFVRNSADRQLTVCELRPTPSHVPPVSNAGNSSHQQRNQIRPPQPVTQQLKSVESGAYIRDGHPHGLLHQIHVTSVPAVAAPSASSGEQPPKRPRIDMPPTPAIATPLTIDTREAVKESIYHPQVEAISPTGPEGSVERDDLKAIKDNLLLEITRVDREILKAESQIAKLKKKQQEVEEASNKPSESSDEIERPKNQSIAQVIYAENRKKARLSHAMLEKFAPINSDLPLYNQPSDTGIYHANKRHHADFKKVLVEHFKRKNEEREANERHTTETYTLMSATWMKKVEKMENSKKRREREAKARELYEKNFPELRKQREDKERDHRLGSRGAVRSDADIEDVIERLQEQEMEDKKMHSYAVIPPLLLPPDVRRRKFINTNGLIHDPLKDYNERKFFNFWTDAEKEIFKEKFLLHPKNFGQIAQFLERKTVSDCVQYYYLSKKTENYKQLLRKTKRRKKGAQPHQSDQVISNATGVVTRHRNRNEDKTESNNQDELGGSNRSTPQPSSLIPKHDLREVREERDDDAGERRTTRGRETVRNDMSEEDEVPVKNGPYTCAACKTLVDQSRAVTQKTLAVHLGLREDDTGPDVRVCNICYAKALKKKHAYCPVPSCTSTKTGGRLGHMPKGWSIIQKDLRDVISKEMQLGDGLKKCCPGCFNKINRRINQLMDGNGGSDHAAKQDVPETTWTEDEIEDFKNLLRANGKNWQLIGEKLCKSAEQSKKFFYDNRKKAHFDKILLEYKKAHPTADQFAPISTDEESGSSTSSGEEDMQTNTAGPSRSNSPASRKGNPEAMDPKPSGDMYQSAPGSAKSDSKVETEDAKLEGKSPLVHPSSHRIISREEEYDSSATMSADERESESHPTRTYPFFSGHQLQSNFPPQGQVGPRLQHFTTPLDMKRPVFSQGQPPIRIGTGQLVPSPITQVTSNGTRENRAESITVKELMINVIERSLSSVPATTGPAPPPTLDGILESSAKPPIHSRPAYQREVTATPPMPARVQSQPGPMAPPPAVPRPSPHISNDSETLDLSMPKRRDCTPPPTPSLQQGISMQYKEPVAPLHHSRASPPEMYAKSPAPPPAHSANKAKNYPDPYLQNQRIESAPQLGYTITQTDGRRMTTPPHLPPRSNPSPGVSHPRAIAPQIQLRPVYSSMGVPRQPGMIPKPPASSPKLQEIERPLTIQTGSITQGTPVSQGHSRGYESLLKVTPPGSSVDKGSITQGTPVYDKKHHLINLPQETSSKTVMYERPATVEFYRKSGQSPVTAPPYPFVPTRQPTYINEPHLGSGQVLMNDYAMARSNEMQRRPESREREQHHAPSPGLLPSPRSRTDMRVVPQVDVRSRNDRYELPRSLPEARGDPKADLPSMQHRGDPRAGLEPRQDMRIDLRGRQPQTTMERGEPRLIEPRMHMDSRYVPGVAAVVTRPSTSIYQQQMYVGAEGRYLSAATLQRDARSMSPPRVTPPPPRSMGTSATIVPPRSIITGSMTSGAKQVEILRAHPEVTISKTNSPRHMYSEPNPLNSFVDVVLQQKKLPEAKDRPIHLAQQVRMTPYERPKYDAYENHRDRYPQGIPSSSHGSNPEVQLVQQLKTDRSKQLSLLPGDRIHQDRSFTITPGPPPQRIPAGNSELTVKPGPSHIPRPPSNSGGRVEQGEPRTVTAASLIDAIITHSINSGPNEAGVASPTVYRCSPEGPGNGDYKLTNGPSEAHRLHDHQKELSIAEHVGSYGSKEQLGHPSDDLYLKRRPEPQPHRAATTLMSAPRNAASLVHGDERQITRVERVSPRHQMGPGVEPISPPNHVLHGISPPVPEDPIAKFLESQKRAENKSGALNAPVISPLDYVKNRIVEEMKKGEHTIGEDSKNQSNPKRPIEQSTSGSPEVSVVGESPRKKMRIENELPDSPGSGEMVIDESARPESVSSQKTASPAPSAQGSSSQGVAVTSAARYEPLSDDD